MDTNSSLSIFEVSVSNISLIVSMSLMCACAIIGNILVIVTVLGTKKLRTITSVFLLNLSFCDLCLGTVMMPLTVQGVVERRWIHSQISCQIVGMFTNILIVGSISTVAAIALDRYLAIIHCFRYSSFSNWKYPTCVLTVIWVFAILNGIPPLFGGWSHVEYVNSRFACLVSWERHLGYAIMMFFFSFLFPFFIMMFCYLRIIRVARIHARRIGDINTQLKHNAQNQQVSTNGIVAFAFMDPIRRLSMLGLPSANIYQRNNNGIEVDFFSAQSTHSDESGSVHTSRFQREAKAIIRLLSLIVVFLICWAPFVYTNMKMSVEFFRSGTTDTSFSLKAVSFWLIALHSAINPLIYAIVSRRFRIALKRMIKSDNGTLQNGDGEDEIQALSHKKISRCVSAPIPYDNDSLKSVEPEIFTVEQFLSESNERYQMAKNNNRRSKQRLGRTRSSSDAFRFGSRHFLEVPGYISSNNNIRTTSFSKRSEDDFSGSYSTSAAEERRGSLSSIHSVDDSVFSNGIGSKNNTVTIKLDLVR